MVSILIPGAAASAALKQIKTALKARLGADGESSFPGFSNPTAPYDAACVAAVREMQARNGLVADGVIGPLTLSVLGLDSAWAKLPATFGIEQVQKMFPFTRRSNIERQLPYVLAALRAVGPGVSAGVVPAEIVLSALATIRAETEGFLPISEGRSKFNTDPGAQPFNRYVGRLGNKNLADAQNFCGRGFVQLTGRANFEHFGGVLGLDLAQNFALANAPEVAACLLAEFIAAKSEKLLAALRKDPPAFAAARKLVNGGSHGLDRYTEAYRLGERSLLAAPAVTRAGARRRRGAGAQVQAAKAPAGAPRKLTAKRDPLDLRDRTYQPRVRPLPPACPPPEILAEKLARYASRRSGLILDQGREGSCTGFGLACVVNFQRWVMAGAPSSGFEPVSPRMLYEMARRYDEYEGENYDGSSCRGAIRGFHQNGVCRESRWPYDPEEPTEPKADWLQDARENTLGVYYRLDTKIIADMQAAIVEAHAVFVSCSTHDGWQSVPTRRLGAKSTMDDVPTIGWPGTPDGGAHAFALVGFDREGFILQNSWGRGWGAGGFARMRYADWLANAMDAWVLSLGVPGVLPRAVALRVPPQASALSSEKAGASGALDARRYTVEMGNDGRVDSFYGEDERRRTLGYQAATLPAQWMRDNTPAGKPWRLAVYAHGGLTSLDDALRKTATMAPYFLANGVYPLFLGWKTGGLETPAHILEDGWNDLVRRQGARAGAGMGDWLREKRNQAVENIARGPVRSLWSEMKENARRAAQERHGLHLLGQALEELVGLNPNGVEIHLIGHSAGSILLGHFLRRIEGKTSLAPKSIHLYAPACTVAFANEHYDHWFDRTHLHLLSDRAELADCVTSAYGRSLLFLVANALEADRRTPLLGMARSFDPACNGEWNGLAATLASLNQFQDEWPIEKGSNPGQWKHPRVMLYDDPIATQVDLAGKPLKTESPTHGGFDNDVNVLTRVLTSLLGAAPAVKVTDLRNS